MIPPEFPDNEKQRQAAVEKYKLLDTLPEESYDSITSLLAYICSAPISLITLLDKDRNFLKSHFGIPLSESPRTISFCGHAINSPDPITIVEDARKDERFMDNPLVDEHQAIFYAGAPLVDSKGFKLGTLCVYDHKPRQLTDAQIDALINMSKHVVLLFEQRYQNFKLKEFQHRLTLRNENLEKFANLVSHDLKSPLTNIASLTDLLELDYKDKLDEKALQYLSFLKASSNSLKDYINGLLSFYKSEELLEKDYEEVHFDRFMEELKKITDIESKVIFQYPATNSKLHVNKTALMQVFINLVTNSIKYNNKPNTIIDINFEEQGDNYEFVVKDNGGGIPSEYLDKIFDMFSIVGITDKNGSQGTGIGLATVKKIIEKLGGQIKVSSVEGEGSTFTFFIAKG